MVWYPVKDFNYEVNSQGFIRNATSRKIITPVITELGYFEVRLNKNAKQHSRRLHRLIYEAIIGKIPIGYHINHINGIRNDNRIENLEAITPQENQAKRLNLLRGEATRSAKFTAKQVMEIRERKRLGESSAEIAQEYGVYKSTINKMVTGITWKHLPLLKVDNSVWSNPKATGAMSGKKLAEKYGKQYFKTIQAGKKWKKHCQTCTCNP